MLFYLTQFNETFISMPETQSIETYFADTQVVEVDSNHHKETTKIWIFIAVIIRSSNYSQSYSCLWFNCFLEKWADGTEVTFALRIQKSRVRISALPKNFLIELWMWEATSLFFFTTIIVNRLLMKQRMTKVSIKASQSTSPKLDTTNRSFKDRSLQSLLCLTICFVPS